MFCSCIKENKYDNFLLIQHAKRYCYNTSLNHSYSKEETLKLTSKVQISLTCLTFVSGDNVLNVPEREGVLRFIKKKM